MSKTPLNMTKDKKSRPKTKLGIPDLEHSKAAVPRSLKDGLARCQEDCREHEHSKSRAP
jgi:hypothetical protein